MKSTKVQQLQLLQHNLQNILAQKQQLQNQLVELDSALTELKNTEKAYKIIGKIMITSSPQILTAQLEEKKSVADVRLNNFSKQEKKLQKNLEELQQEVMQELQTEKK